MSDILSHVTDGPLVLWPIDDTIRLRGPFSHRDPAFGGLWVSALEALAGTVFRMTWPVRRVRRRIGGQPGDHGSEVTAMAALPRRLTVIR